MEHIPTHIEKPVENISEELRKHRALNRIFHALVEATKSIEIYISSMPHEEVIRKVHTDMTNLVDYEGQPVLDDSGLQKRARYFSLWTSFGDFRLLENGHLAHNKWQPNLKQILENDGDNSYIVTLHRLQSDSRFDSMKLTEIATQLEKFCSHIASEES